VAWLAVCLVVLGIRLAVPFEHGTWTVAYLLLVGSIAPALLALGQAALLSERTSLTEQRAAIRIQGACWAFGVLAVPLGVLAEARIAVVLGGLSLLVSLASLFASVSPELVKRSDALAAGYLLLLVGMTASVFVGTGLAWDLPWV
jgi:hypothetical protein